MTMSSKNFRPSINVTLSLIAMILIGTSLVLGADNPCQEVPFVNGQSDITPLAESHYEVSVGGGNRLVFGLCSPVPQLCEGNQAKSIELFSGGECYKMAAQGNSDIIFEPLDESSTLMTYTGGQSFHSTYKLGTEITLICDESVAADSAPKVKYTGEKGPETKGGIELMLTTVEMRSARLCPGGGNPILYPFGILGLAMFLCLIGFVLYFVIGFIVQVIRKKRGADIPNLHLIPNFRLWKELLLLEKDGILFCKDLIMILVNKIRRRNSGSGGLHGIEDY